MLKRTAAGAIALSPPATTRSIITTTTTANTTTTATGNKAGEDRGGKAEPGDDNGGRSGYSTTASARPLGITGHLLARFAPERADRIDKLLCSISLDHRDGV
jgi:hypothetical protein